MDTQGLEIGRDDGALIKELRQVVRDLRKKPMSEQIHCAWYCVRGMDRRFEESEVNFVRALAELEIPVLLVLTQVPMRDGQFHPDAVSLARHIESLKLPIIGGRPVHDLRDEGPVLWSAALRLERGPTGHVSGSARSRPGSPGGCATH